MYIDKYDIHHWLPEWGFDHHAVCHGRRDEYARDDDDDGRPKTTFRSAGCGLSFPREAVAHDHEE